MDWHALTKRLARTGGLAFMIAGGILCGQAVSEAISGTPDATLNAAIYAATFSFGGILFTWARKQP